MVTKYKTNLKRRKTRARAKIKRINPKALRLSVLRSNKHIYAQVIDVKNKGKIVAFASDKELKEEIAVKSKKAEKVGEILAEKCLKNKIKQVIFDRSGYSFHGRVKALAQGARNKGLRI